MKREKFWFLVKQLFVVAVLVTLLRGFILIPIPVAGNSMNPVLQAGDTLIMEKISKIRRFDLIVFTRPDGTTLVKRVIGLPGEKVAVKDDQLYINDEVVAENFLADTKETDDSHIPLTSSFTLADLTGSETLGATNYFVMGDNRRLSKDSRAFGPIDASEILGKARMVYAPITHLKWLQ